MTTVLETINLTKRFTGLVAANDVSLRVEKGARHALIGPNGAGKTTLINLLTGVLRPTSGRILLDNSDITEVSTHKRVKLGIVRTFQINQLFGDLTPLETIGLAVSERRGQGLDWWRIVGSRPDLVTEAVEILDRFKLTDVMHERTAVLPYGKQRLLEIAVAIACRPRLLLLDEPAAGFTPQEKVELMRLVGKILESGVTVFLIEHDMKVVMGISKRISEAPGVQQNAVLMGSDANKLLLRDIGVVDPQVETARPNDLVVAVNVHLVPGLVDPHRFPFRQRDLGD